LKREAIFIRCSPDGKRHIYVDSDNAQSILSYIEADTRHRKKFRFIADIILGGHKNHEAYDKEEPNDKCKGKGVYGMKFFKGQENDRIYCRQFTSKGKIFIVIAVELYLGKKTTKLNAEQIGILEKIATYEYDL
jgi:hypothetical protein